MRQISFLAVFFLAMWAMSAGWAAIRATWQAPDIAGVIEILAYVAVLAASLFYLGFWIYAWDRAAGRVRRTIGIYERFLRGKS